MEQEKRIPRYRCRDPHCPICAVSDQLERRVKEKQGTYRMEAGIVKVKPARMDPSRKEKRKMHEKEVKDITRRDLQNIEQRLIATSESAEQAVVKFLCNDAAVNARMAFVIRGEKNTDLGQSTLKWGEGPLLNLNDLRMIVARIQEFGAINGFACPEQGYLLGQLVSIIKVVGAPSDDALVM